MSAVPVAGVSTGGTSRAPLSGALKDWGSACTNPDQPKPTKKAAAKGAQRVPANFIFGSCNGDKKIAPIIRDSGTVPTRSLKPGWRSLAVVGAPGMSYSGLGKAGTDKAGVEDSGCRLSRSARA